MAARILVVDDHQELATLLGAALEGRGHEVEIAGSGERALRSLRTRRPDAAIVDLLLPDMLGNDVVDALVSSSPPVPVLAISGVFRESPERHPIVAEHGATLFLEKPFSTRTLLEAIATMVESPGLSARHEEEEALQEAQIEEALDTVIEEKDPLDLSARAPSPSAGSTAAGALRRMGFVEDLSPQNTERSLSTRAASPSPLANTGDLAETWVPRLLAAQHLARAGGSLILRKGQEIKAIYFHEGTPIYAASNLARDRLVAHAVSTGALSRDDAEAALAIARESKKKVGQILLEMEVVDRSTLTSLVQAQLRGLVWSTFDWREGRYQLRPAATTRSKVGMGMGLGPLILQGLETGLELPAIQGRLGPPERCLGPGTAPNVPLEDLDLDPEAARLLVMADGTKSVADLLTLADPIDKKRAHALLTGFEVLGLLVPREQMLKSLSRVGFLI